MNFFSKNLKYLRKEMGMSRSELANKLSVNQSTISRWENGDMGVTVDNAYDVANYFNISIADLTGRDLTVNNNDNFDELELLFSKNKDILTDEYKENKNIILREKNRLLKEINKVEKPKTENKKKEIIENGKKVYEILTDDKISLKEKNEVAHILINKVEYDPTSNTLELYYN